MMRKQVSCDKGSGSHDKSNGSCDKGNGHVTRAMSRVCMGSGSRDEGRSGSCDEGRSGSCDCTSSDDMQ